MSTHFITLRDPEGHPIIVNADRVEVIHAVYNRDGTIKETKILIGVDTTVTACETPREILAIINTVGEPS